MLREVSLPLGLGLRALQPQDQAFSEALFASTRDYFYNMPIPQSQIDFLIKQQFQLQQASYAASFPSAEHYIVELFNKPIGKIIVNSTTADLHIIDIALMSDMRAKGFGSMILRALKQSATQDMRTVRLAVDQQNSRAKKLYLSLGFTLIESSSTHDTLLW